MLTALENGVKGGKWFSLIDKVCKPTVLLQAWRKVKANKGAAGVDHIDIERFESQLTVYLQEIREDLCANSYRPQAVRRVHIPKGRGKTRPLGIPTVKDRVVQMALKTVVEPIFEWEFHDHSYGFRPCRGAKDALRHVDHLLKEGFTHVIDVDFQSFFDTIPHDCLMDLVEAKVSDGRVLSLIKSFLTQKVVDGEVEKVSSLGTPQGAVISPLLANIYLNPLDHLVNGLGVPMIRYADDFVILTRSKSQAEAVMKEVLAWANSVGLMTHPEKTKLINYSAGEAFDFLGYRFKSGYRLVRPKSLMKLKDTIRSKTRRTDGRAMSIIIADLNRTIRGWYEYFKHVHYTVLRQVDQMLRRRLRAIYRKREKRPGFGRTHADHRRWPNAHFAKLGLFTTLETWNTERRARNRTLACQSR